VEGLAVRGMTYGGSELCIGVCDGKMSYYHGVLDRKSCTKL